MRKANIKKWVKLGVILAVFATLLLLPQPVQHYTTYVQGYGAGGDNPPPPSSGGSVTGVTTSGGEFTETTTFTSGDGDLILVIPEGTVGETEDGDRLSRISITKVIGPPAPPEDNDFIGLTYDLEPDGATFDPPITITFTYNPNWIPSGLGPENLDLRYYDEDTKTWVPLDPQDIIIDPNTNTISALISHFTYYGVMVHTAPAEFTVSDLSISPAEFEVAEKSTISVDVANIGDVSGTTRVTLKLNGVEVTSTLVTLAGHDSQTVSFTTVQGEPGSYKVDIDGLSGTFTVKPATVKPVVITSTVPSVTAPAVEYPAPTAPALPPAMPAPVPAPTPWLAIIISLVATGIVAIIIVWYYGFRSEY